MKTFSLILAAGQSIFSAEGKEVVDNIISPILMILMVIVSVLLMICVMRQDSDPESMGAITGATETYFGKDKGDNKQYMLKKATVILSISLVVLSIVYFVLQIL